MSISVHDQQRNKHQFSWFEFDCVASTNDVAKMLVKEGRLTDRGIIVAREQTAGRGTRGREWHSPKDGGIYMTAVDFVEFAEFSELPMCTRAAGVAAATVLRDALGIDVRLKPINDLICQGGKLGGILVEALAGVGARIPLLIGIGINVRTLNEFASHGALRPVALEEVCSPRRFSTYVASELIERIAQQVWQSTKTLSERGPGPIVAACELLLGDLHSSIAADRPMLPE